MGGDKKTQWQWFWSLPSFKPHPFVFLCVSSFHPALARSLSLTKTPSLPFHHPPKPSFHHKHTSPTEVGEVGEAFDALFWSIFPSLFLVVTIYHWPLDRQLSFNKNSWKSIIYFLCLKIFCTDKITRFGPQSSVFHVRCQWHSNITVHHLFRTNHNHNHKIAYLHL